MRGVLALLDRRYNPNWASQPRVPRGNPDGGQWTEIPGSVGEEFSGARGGGRRTGMGGESSNRTRVRLAATVPLRRVLRALNAKQPPPDIPQDKPSRMKPAWTIVKEVAYWMMRIGLQETPAGPVLDIIEAAQWIHEFAPYVTAYLDKAKTLGELQKAASEPQ